MLRGLLVSWVTVCVVSHASATTITFDDLASAGTTNRWIGKQYTASGFRFTVPGGAGRVLTSPGSGHASYAGSAALAPIYPSLTPVTVDTANGSPFDLLSLKLSHLNPNSVSPDTVTIIGTQAGTGNQVQAIFDLPDLFGFEPFSLPSTFVALESFSITGDSGYQFDDVELLLVPEPTGLALGLGAAFLLILQRSHRARSCRSCWATRPGC